MPKRDRDTRKPPTPPRIPPEQFSYGGYTIVGEYNTPNWYRSWYDDTAQEMRRLSLGTDDFEQAKEELISIVREEFRDDDALRGDPLVTSVLDGFRDDPDNARKAWSGFPVIRVYAETYWQGITVRTLTPGMRKEFVRREAARGSGPGYIANVLGYLSRAVKWSGEPNDDNRLLCPDPPVMPYSPSWVCKVLGVTEPEPRNYHPERHEMAEVLRVMARQEAARRWALNALFTAGRPSVVRGLGPASLRSRFGMTVVDLHPAGRIRTGKRNACLPVPPSLLAEWREWEGDPWVPCGDSWLLRRVHAVGDECGLPELLPSSFRDYMATALRHAHLDFGVERVSNDDAECWMGHREAPIVDAARARGIHARYGTFRPGYLDVPMRAAEAVVLDLDRRSGGALFRHATPARSRQVPAKSVARAVPSEAFAEGKPSPSAVSAGVHRGEALDGSTRALMDLDAIRGGEPVEIGGIRGSFRQISAKPGMHLDEAFERQPSDILWRAGSTRFQFVPEGGDLTREQVIVISGTPR